MTISRGLLDAILADARSDNARERCGLLLGHGNVVAAHLPAANVALAPERTFELDPAALLMAHRAARTGGLAVLGHYHSHPDGACQPSLRDAAAASADGQLWLIATMADWSAWRAEAGGDLHDAFAPVAIQIGGAD